jgi:hypothetical protein
LKRIVKQKFLKNDYCKSFSNDDDNYFPSLYNIFSGKTDESLINGWNEFVPKGR